MSFFADAKSPNLSKERFFGYLSIFAAIALVIYLIIKGDDLRAYSDAKNSLQRLNAMLPDIVSFDPGIAEKGVMPISNNAVTNAAGSSEGLGYLTQAAYDASLPIFVQPMV